MSPQIPIITAREVIKVARKIGFQFDRQSGSHSIYIHPEKKLRIVIPIHKGKDIKPKTLKGIINDMGISIDDFKRFL
jgi:predicted RNA binding protein YcfA (HicA-like mRNA interferase family)